MLRDSVAELQHGLSVSRADPASDFPLIYVNAAFERMTGYASAEVLGRNCRFLQQVGGARREQPGALRILREALRAGSPATVTLLNYRKNGEPFWNELSLSPVRDAAGAVTHFIGIQQEVSHRPRAVTALRDAAEDAEDESAAAHAMGQLSAMLAHDLREPLAVMRGFAGLARSGLDQGDRHAAQACIQRIVEAGDRMELMISAVMSLARASLAKVDTQPVDLSALAREVVDGLRVQSPGRQVDVEIQSGLSAAGDPVLLKSLLENLLSNAWKYTAPRAQPRIEFGRAQAPGHGTCGQEPFFVRDNGVGFDMGQLGTRGDLFRRLHPGSAFPGHGIGLVSAQTVVNRHAGDLWAHSEPGRGATFYFTLGLPARA